MLVFVQFVGSKASRKRGRPKKSTTEDSTEGPQNNSQPAKTNILEWETEQTCYGTIRRGPNGEVVLPEGVFENMEMFLGKNCIRKVFYYNFLTIFRFYNKEDFTL